jgi:hypothetical protein
VLVVSSPTTSTAATTTGSRSGSGAGVLLPFETLDLNYGCVWLATFFIDVDADVDVVRKKTLFHGWLILADKLK